MKRALSLSLLVAGIVVVLGVGLAAGVLLDRQVLFGVAPPQSIPPGARQDFGLIAEAWNTVGKYYVDQAAAQPITLTYGAISGLVDSLGDTGHSRFLSPAEVKAEQQFTAGQFVGIGIEVEIKSGNITVVAPIDGSPAMKAGIKAGDVILKVDGQSVVGDTLTQVSGMIMGPAGTSVTLTLLDPKTNTSRTVTIVRAKITIQNVTWVQVPGTTLAHVRMAAFSEGVTNMLIQDLQTIQQQQLAGVILDLRNNPGGLLSEAVGTASQFLTGGNVLLEKNINGQTTPVPVESGGVAPSIPVVVLVDVGTASSSEIVSGALQDAKRAELVGETTFGTGTVLNEFSLSNGSAILLATQEWLTPDGHSIWHVGIEPNYVVPLGTNASPLLPEQERSMSASDVAASGDAQLLKALDLLGQPLTSSTP